MFGFCGQFCHSNQQRTQIIYEAVVPNGAHLPASRTSFKSLSGLTEDMRVDKIIKSRYQGMVQTYNNSNLKFVDDEFPPNNTSLGDYKLIKGRSVQWRRVTEIIEDPKLLQYTSPNEVIEDNLGDCYFVSSIAAIAENPARIRNLFGTVNFNDQGLYMVRCNVSGVQKEIVIDDYFPVYTHNQQLIYTKPIKKHDIWVMLLHKVWAKIVGCFAMTQIGYSHEVLTTFSNAPCFYTNLGTIQDKNKLWQDLQEARRENYPVCCSSKSSINSISGIVQSATYCLASCFEVRVKGAQHRILGIRNPWQQYVYTGPYSQQDRIFWNSAKAGKAGDLEPFDKQKIFLIGFEDFFRYFQSLDISHTNSLSSYNFECVGAFSNQGVYFNIQIKDSCECYFILQQERRLKGMQNTNRVQFSKMTLVIGRWETDHYQWVDSKLETHLPTMPIKCSKLAPGNYLAYAKCEWAHGKSNQLTFATYSSSTVEIQKTKPKNNFIESVMMDHAIKRGKRTYLDNMDTNEWVSLELLYKEGGYAYIFAFVEAASSKKILLECSKQEFAQSGLRIVDHDSERIRLIAKAGSPQMILCEVLSDAHEIVFPPPIKISRSV